MREAGSEKEYRHPLVRVVPFGLLGGTAVEAPTREFFQFRESLEVFDERFAADVRNGGVTVEPDVFQLVLCHMRLVLH